MKFNMAVGTSLKVLQKSDRGSRLTLQVPQQIVVPSYFMCPISLELMKDPVTLSTGMTYDRDSIEKWLGSGHNTCPTTNQLLESHDLIPNHTLRRLIQNWCVANKSYGVERIPTPKQPVEPETVKQLLHSIAQRDRTRDTLKGLWYLAKESERNRKCITEAGAVPILSEYLATLGLDRKNHSAGCSDREEACEDALSTIALLQLGDGDKKALADPQTLSSLCSLLAAGSLDAKVNVADLLLTVCEEDPCVKQVVGAIPGTIKGLFLLLKEDLYPRAVQASLKCLLSLCIPRRNRVVAIECSAINVLVELLPNTERRNMEHAFALMEILANCAEGREAISNHVLAIPVIVKSLVGVSHRATEHAVAALWVVLSFASNRSVINSALQAGAFTKLLMLLPSDCSQRAKQKARDSLKLLNEVWGSYTCRPTEDSGLISKQDVGQIKFTTELV